MSRFSGQPHAFYPGRNSSPQKRRTGLSALQSVMIGLLRPAGRPSRRLRCPSRSNSARRASAAALLRCCERCSRATTARPGWHVYRSHRAFSLVLVLAAGAASAERLEADIGRLKRLRCGHGSRAARRRRRTSSCACDAGAPGLARPTAPSQSNSARTHRRRRPRCTTTAEPGPCASGAGDQRPYRDRAPPLPLPWP